MVKEVRNFGIEIELGTKYKESQLKRLIRNNTNYKLIPVSKYSNWHIDEEPSINFSQLGIEGMEIVSPILTIDKDFNDIKSLFYNVISSECYVNYSCGLHVHVEVKDLTEIDLKKIVKYMSVLEPFLFKSLPNTRYNSDFSQPLPPLLLDLLKETKGYEDFFKRYYSYFIREVDKRENIVAEMKKLKKMKYGVHNSRNLALNIHSVWYRGTLEFRYFPATLSFEETYMYIDLCLSIVTSLLSKGENEVEMHCNAYKDDYEELLKYVELDKVHIKNMLLLYAANKDGIDMCEITLFKN